MPAGLDIAHAALALLVFVLAALLFAKRGGADPALTEKLEEELRSLRDKPLEHEFRVERFELLWYPVVTHAPTEKKILKVSVGLPYCPKCCVPMKARDDHEWSCAKCDRRCPASIADLSVMDAIEKLVRGYFRDRHPEYEA